jgi:CRP/FNR family transcriptional regulator, cyclic AMP receptor protein
VTAVGTPRAWLPPFAFAHATGGKIALTTLSQESASARRRHNTVGRMITVKKEKTAPQKRLRKSAKAAQMPEMGPRFDRHALIAFVGAERSRTTLRPKTVVYRQGDSADAVHYIEAGKIRLTVVSEHGKEGVIAMLEPGEFFGEGCIIGQPLRIATASTAAKSTVIRIEKNTMIRALQDHPAFSETFLAFVLARNIQIEADLVDHLFNSSERRLARLLLLLANFGKEGKLEAIIPKISQDILAARVGTTRSRINFFMNKFRKLGFIEYGASGLNVHSSLLNIIVHE